MPFPLISEYIEAIKSAEDNFEELSYLRPVLGDDGLPIMTSGNFAVVFKMKDEQSGKFYAVKCFTKEQEGRAEAYREIAKELKDVSSPYLVSIQYLEKELFVDTDQATETEFPVLLMDWVEGKTLDKYLRENLDDKYALEMLAYRFSQLAQWLIPHPFAHGDLKPDNILVREDGTLVLVDYDGMYVPAMKGQKARELGSPDFRHPFRTEDDFDEHIDDFPIMSILISLIGISKSSSLWEEFGAPDRLLLSRTDYANIENQKIINDLFLINDDSLRNLTCVFVSLCHHSISITIPTLEKPIKFGNINGYFIPGVNLLSDLAISKPKCPLSIEQVLEGLMELNDLMKANGIDYVLTGSLGLYIHGLVPESYVPHDIDIIISSDKNKHLNLTSQMILDLFSQHSGGYRPGYEYIDASNMFVFYIGLDKIEINAFVDVNNVFANSDFCVMNIMGHEIKVNNTLSIFKEKYKMRRLKDFKFNNDIQEIINGYLCEQPHIIEERKEMTEEEMKDWISFFFKSIDVEFSTSIKVFPILFDNQVKTQWLTLQQCYDCSVKTIVWDEYKILSWDSVPFEPDAIEYNVKGKINKKCKPNETMLTLGHLGDFRYIASFLYEILKEMGLIDSFLTNVYKLISIVNSNRKKEKMDAAEFPLLSQK